MTNVRAKGCNCVDYDPSNSNKITTIECPEQKICMINGEKKMECIQKGIVDSELCDNKAKCLCTSNKKGSLKFFKPLECRQNYTCFDLEELKCIKELVAHDQICQDNFCMCYESKANFRKPDASRIQILHGETCIYENNKLGGVKLVKKRPKRSRPRKTTADSGKKWSKL